MRRPYFETLLLLSALLGACNGDSQGGGTDAGRGDGELFDLAMKEVPDLAVADELMRSPVDLRAPDIMGAKLIFVTENRFDGDLRAAGGATTGLEGGDRLCTTSAIKAGLGGKWVAWLSDDTTNAIDRVVDVGPWYSLDGRELFKNVAGMANDASDAVSLSEFGQVPVSCQNLDVDECKAWTATMMGVRETGRTCVNWTTASKMAGAWVGSGLSQFGWLGGHWEDCTNRNHLFCIQQ